MYRGGRITVNKIFYEFLQGFIKKMLQVGIEPTTTASRAYIQLYKSSALPAELLELQLQ